MINKRESSLMIRCVLLGAAILLCVGRAVADDSITLQCEAAFRRQASYAPDESGKTVLGVNVILGSQSVRRIIVFDRGDKVAVLDATTNAKLKGHASVNTSDSRRWSLYNTWAAAYGDPESTRISIDRNSGDIAFERKIYSGSD